jgi:hypothetical protein
MKRWQLFLLLLIVAIFPYGKALVSGHNLGPTDHIQTMLTPNAPKPNYGWDILQADGVIQFLPWRDLVFDAWRKGEAPIMNPYQLAGQPLTANSQSGGFYPLHMIFAFVPGSTGFKIILLGILHLFIAGLGMFTLLRNMKVSEHGAIVGAIGFSLSQFMVAWAPLASVPTTVAWIPWIMAGILTENRRVGFFLIALATAMMMLAGHLQFAFYGLFAAFLLATWEIVQCRKVIALVPFVAMGVGLLVSYPQVSLVLQNSQTSHRKNIPTEEGYQGYTAGVLAPFELIGLISPKLMGDPSVQNSELEGSGVQTGFWPMLIKRGANPAECALWISPAVLTLALLGFFVKRRKDSGESSVIPATLLLVLGGLLAFGSPLNRLLFFYFPGWSATGSAGRAHVLIVLGLCIAGAIGFDRLSAKNDGTKKWFGICLVPFVLLALGFNVMNMLGGMLGQPGDDTLSKIISLTTKPYLADIAVTALFSCLTLSFIVKWRDGKYVFTAAAFFVFICFFNRPLSGRPLELPNLNIPAQERTVFVGRNWDMFKTPNASVPPNIASLMRVHDLFGYDSILDKSFVEKLRLTIGKDPAPPQNGNMMLLRGVGPDFLSQEISNGFLQLGVTTPIPSELNGVYVSERTPIKVKSERNIGTTIIYDGYDHQVIECIPGTKEFVIKDRFFDGMTSPTPNTTVENQDGWRHIKTDGKQTSIRINYPGRMNYIGVIIGVAILLFGLIITLRKHEPDPVST